VPGCGGCNEEQHTLDVCGCYYCTVRCPQDIHITDVMYTLKNMSLETKQLPQQDCVGFLQDLHQLVETYGRSFEIGLAGFTT